MSFFDNFSQFHFLRPEWLWTLLLLPLLWRAMHKQIQAGSDWSTAIDPKLLKYLMPKKEINTKHSSFYGLIILIALSIISISGPSWQEKPQPVLKLSDNMVVILDLSLSMLATDIKPNRLTKAKQKLQDLLSLRKEGNTALIAFSGDSHVVTPLTDDTNTIAANLPALDPFIMPVIGSRPDKAIAQAIALLKQGKARKGRIVLLTDGVEEYQTEEIGDLLSDTEISLYILAAGTKEGGPIDIPGRGYFKDNDKVIIPKTNLTLLNSLASDNRGKMHVMTLDDEDLQRFDISGEQTLKRAEAENSEQLVDKRFDAWEDMGFLLLLFIIPIALYAHRQNALILIAVCLIFPSEKSYALSWDDLWQTPDQQAQKLLDQGSFEEAAERFESSEHKANAHYQAKQFDEAEKHYTNSNQADSLYNKANSLAQQQKFEEALELYSEALSIDEDHEDSRHNKKLIEDFLKQQESSSENQDQQNQDQQNQDQQQENESDNEDEQKAEATKADATQLSEEEKQSYEQWMRRVPDDPGGLLRRKFEQQSIERNRNSASQSREEGEPIW